ncbi:MAG: DUF3291 domain-containing protein [Maribacter sp.]|uniref:DUF3291 domain-containing protein n=1 Tax=Maribacter sp. TaxID=1897614 RepID=UPI0032997D1E
MNTYHLAQVNIARMLAPIDSEVMTDFVANLDRINQLAEKSDGFVWRLKDENDNATSLQVFEDEFIIVNMSVWNSKKSLFEFTYNSAHLEVFKRKKEWFSKMRDMHMALWWVPIGVEPKAEDAKERLKYLNAKGETPFAFSFKSDFSAAEAEQYKP